MSEERVGALTESVLAFGGGEHLSGVLTRVSGPACVQGAGIASMSSPERGGLGVLLLNAGVIARTGPHRFNVKLARALANHGLPVLRFDVSGQGDSGTTADALPQSQQVTNDIVGAIDVMERMAGVEQVLIVGLCSGANQGWIAALVDPRIAGLVMIDPFAYPTGKTLAKYHWRRIRLRGARGNLSLAGRSLRKAAGYLLQEVSRRLKQSSNVSMSEESDYESRLPLSEYVQGMQRLVDRGVNLLLIYTGSWSRHYSYPEQFSDLFGPYPFAAQIQCEYVPQFDHTLTLVSTQQKMIRRIESWIELVLAQHQLSRSDRVRVAASRPACPTELLAAGR